jgi:thioredoxin 1
METMLEITLTKENFEAEVLQATMPVLVDFWAPWCGPCKVVGPVIAEIAQEYAGRVKVGKVNVDEQPDLAQEFGILSIPTMKFFHAGQAVDELIGAAPKDMIVGKLEKMMTATTEEPKSMAAAA